MPIFKIARMGHPVLSMPANAIAEPTAPHWKNVVRNMIDTLADADGIGLAAPQIHIPARLVILHIPNERLDDEIGDNDGAEAGAPPPETQLTIMVNPKIESVGDEMELGWESCLSLPGLAGEVPRYRHIRVSHLDLDGTAKEFEARDFHARVIQHECDHLDGILYVQRMEDMSNFGFSEDINKARVAEEQMRTGTDG